VVFEQSFYSVPFRLVGQQVRVRGCSREVRIYAQDYQRVATHPRAQQPGERHTHPDHLPPEKLPGLLLSRAACRQEAAAIGAATAAVVAAWLDDPAVDRLPTVGRLLRLGTRYGAGRLEAACARARCFEDPSYATIKRILVQGLDLTPAPLPLPTRLPPARAFVRTAADLLGHLFGGVA
jgi:hypothetical protein